MSNDTALGYLLGKIAEERTRAVANVISGRITQNDYHRVCGAIQTFDYMTALIEDVEKRLQEGADE